MQMRGTGLGSGGADAPSMRKWVPSNDGSACVHISRQIVITSSNWAKRTDGLGKS